MVLGSLGFAPIHELAQKKSLKEEILAFPGDESLITAICLDPTEKFAFVAKGSNKLYAVDLAVGDKRPFISKIVQLDTAVVEVSSTKDFGLWVLLESGKLLNFNSPQLQEGKLEIPVKEPIGCMSKIEGNLMALGGKNSSKIHLIYLDSPEIEVEEISVPFEELECGSIGISSIFSFQNGNSLLFSCKPEVPDNDDVRLLLLENILEENGKGEGLKFSHYYDPCASRPPRTNQFYYLNAGKWSDDLVEFVVIGNYASPDIGICGRVSTDGNFEAFYIDNDEGLAQLPFINGDSTFPVGMALDFSSKIPLENLVDPDAEAYPPAPILWVLTDSGHLCPFSMLKTDLTEPLSFMKSVPIVNAFEESIGSTEIPKVITAVTTPQTPSKVPLQQLASLQKSTSTEIKPLDSPSTPATTFSGFKLAPVVTETKPAIPVTTGKKTESVTSTVTPSKPFANEPPEPVLVRKEEKMESISVGPYQSILLTEIAATHAAMQEDIFALKQLSLKNSLLLRQNSQKYFNSLGSLEIYAVSLEKLLKSSENVFAGVKDKVEALKFSLNELMGHAQSVKSNWNRIKQDRKINWDARVKSLTAVSEDLFDKIDRLRNFLSNPTEASKYRATLKSFVDSAQEKVQLLMAHLSGLFVASKSEDNSEFYADLGALNLSLSSSSSGDNLLDQLNVLSLNSSHADSSSKIEKRNKSLLNSVKSRGARLLIPSRAALISPSAQTEKALKLSAEDENLISSFVSAIKLTEEVPEFAETAAFAKLSLNEDPKVAETKIVESKPIEAKITELKPIEPKITDTKPIESKITDTKPTFSFNAPSTAKPAVATDYKPSFNFNLPSESKFTTGSKPIEATESKPFGFKVTEPKPVESKPFEFKVTETKPAETTESKPFGFKIAETTESKPFEFKVTETTDSKPFEFKASPAAPVKPSFSFAPAAPADKSDEPKTTSFSFKPSDTTESPRLSSPEISTVTATETATASSNVSSTKIPSIFTVTTSNETETSVLPAEPVSVLKKESPLPTFESLSFGSKSQEQDNAEIKPFPSIFGVKPSVSDDVKEVSETESKSPEVKEPEITKADVSEKEKEAVSPISSSSGFSFGFKPTELSSPKATEASTQPQTSHEPSNLTSPQTQTSQPAQTQTSQTQPFSFSFAPSSTQPTASTGFSITTKPSFPSPAPAPAPAFGATSMPTGPTFGSTSIPAFGTTSLPTAPAFGQTSLPSFGGFGSNSGSGFAAFAASTSASNSGFSAFASDNNNANNGGSLTFASFLPSDKKQQDSNNNNNNNNTANKPSNPSSTFSFTGFRE